MLIDCHGANNKVNDFQQSAKIGINFCTEDFCTEEGILFFLIIGNATPYSLTSPQAKITRVSLRHWLDGDPRDLVHQDMLVQNVGFVPGPGIYAFLV